MYKFLIALRYIQSRLITIFSIIGVAVGVTVLVIVLAVMDGFRKEFIYRLQGTLSHIIIAVRTPKYNYLDIEKKIKAIPHVVACSPHLNGLVLIGTGRFYAGGMVIGIDYDKERQIGKMEEYLVTPYREEKLRAEEFLEENVKRVYQESLAWQVVAVQKQPPSANIAPLTRVVCKKIRTLVSTVSSKLQFKPMEEYIAYSIGADNQIMIFEPDLSAKAIEEAISGQAKADNAKSAAEIQRWQKYFDELAQALNGRDINGYLAKFSTKLRNASGDIHPDNPFLIDQEDERPALVGYELMHQLGLKRGDEISLMTGKRDPADDKLKAVSRKFVIAGAFKSGWQEIDARLVYTRRQDLIPNPTDADDKGFLDIGNDISEVCVMLDDFQHADEVKKSLDKTLNDVPYERKFVVERWEDRRKNLLAAIGMERIIMTIILSLIVILAVVTIMIILVLMVSEKTKDIGILKSMGASDSGIMGIFLSNGFFISLFGSILGCISGIIFCLHINSISDVIYEHTGFRVFPRDVYYLDQIPIELSANNIVAIVVITLLLTLVACLIPALKAARMDVVEALNSEFPSLRWWRRKLPLAPTRDAGTDKFFEVVQISREYLMGHATLQILQGISLDVKKGEILAIVGTSGAGKSTLLHLMGLLDTPSEGGVYLRGQNLNMLSGDTQAKIRNEKLGFVFQFYHLLPEFSALANVLMAAQIKYGVLQWPSVEKQMVQRAEELLTKVGLAERMTHLPRELSGGERQRVAIARSLMNNPEIVLCDEPTGNLDEKNALAIQELLWSLNKEFQQTFIIVTHQEALAQKAHRLFRLEHGKLQAAGK